MNPNETANNTQLLQTGLKEIAALHGTKMDYTVGVRGLIHLTESGFTDTLAVTGLFSSFNMKIQEDPGLATDFATQLNYQFQLAQERGSDYQKKTVFKTANLLGLTEHPSYSKEFNAEMAAGLKPPPADANPEARFPRGTAQQLTRTWAFSGLAGKAGLNIYAASTDLGKRVSGDGDDIIEKASSFEMPKDISSATTRPKDMPVSMIFIVDNGSRVLANRAYAENDPHGRGGNYFAHTLVDLPQDFTARDAVRLWNSPFWQRRLVDQRPGYTLPPVEVSTLKPGPDKLEEAVFQKEDEALIAQAISAYLTNSSDKRMLVVGYPEDTIEVVSAITRALPLAMFRDLTFDTYTAYPSHSLARIVGTIGAPLINGNPRENPTLSSEAKDAVVIDFLTGKSSGLPEAISDEVRRYASFAAAQLVEGGDAKKLAQFIRQAEAKGIHDVQGLLAKYAQMSNESFLGPDFPPTSVAEQKLKPPQAPPAPDVALETVTPPVRLERRPVIFVPFDSPEVLEQERIKRQLELVKDAAARGGCRAYGWPSQGALELTNKKDKPRRHDYFLGDATGSTTNILSFELLGRGDLGRLILKLPESGIYESTFILPAKTSFFDNTKLSDFFEGKEEVDSFVIIYDATRDTRPLPRNVSRADNIFFRDHMNRPGGFTRLLMALPLSLYDPIRLQMASDPTFVRKLIHQFIVEKCDPHQYREDLTIPPYQKFDEYLAANGQPNRMLLADYIDDPALDLSTLDAVNAHTVGFRLGHAQPAEGIPPYFADYAT